MIVPAGVGFRPQVTGKIPTVVSAVHSRGHAELVREGIWVSWISVAPIVGITLHPTQGLAGFLLQPYLRQAPITFLIACVLVLLMVAVLALWRRRATERAEHPFSGELGMLRAIVGSLPDLIYVKDENSRFLLGNQGVAEALGAASCADLIGKTDYDYFPEDVAAAFYQDEQKILQTGQPLVEQDEHLQLPDGRERWVLTTKVPYRDSEGQTVGIIGIGRNITAIKDTEAELKRSRENLHFKATHDGLTSLLNREAILDMLGREMTRGSREGSSAAVLLADLDHFKQINDRFGHPVGDEVLRETARRFLRAVRSYDLVGRYGGEEFLILLPGCSEAESFSQAERLRKQLTQNDIRVNDTSLRVTASFGVTAAIRGEPWTPEGLIRKADEALYVAKKSGRNRVEILAYNSSPAPSPADVAVAS